MDPQATMSRDMQECIELCTFCHDACLDTVNYCLTKGGKHAEHEQGGLAALAASIGAPRFSHGHGQHPRRPRVTAQRACATSQRCLRNRCASIHPLEGPLLPAHEAAGGRLEE